MIFNNFSYQRCPYNNDDHESLQIVNINIIKKKIKKFQINKRKQDFNNRKIN